MARTRVHESALSGVFFGGSAFLGVLVVLDSQSGQVSMVKQSMADLPFSDMSESDLPTARENKTLFSSLDLFSPN